MPFIPTLDLNCPNPDYYQLVDAHILTCVCVCVYIHNIMWMTSTKFPGRTHGSLPKTEYYFPKYTSIIVIFFSLGELHSLSKFNFFLTAMF